MAQSGIYPKFRADDRDGEPLSGGKVYSYASGTSTPAALYADPELTTALENPVILDASGEALFYYNGSSYKLTLTDKDDVPQWTIDPVSGSAGGGSASAGVGWGKNTIELRPGAGSAQAVAAVFPTSVLALAVTVWVKEAIGTSQGLTHVGLGTLGRPDCWGALTNLAADTETTAGIFQGHVSQPQPVNGQVTLTAYGGTFDGTGVVYVTGHWATFHPGHEVGMSYAPGQPVGGDLIPPQPAASETVQGLIELATTTETTTGTDDVRAVTPLKLQQKLALLPPASETAAGVVELATTTETTTGTDDSRAVTPLKLQQALTQAHTGSPLSVPRYPADGTGLEASGLSVDALSNLRTGSALAGASAQRAVVLASGVAPTASHPPDAVQLWVADVDGIAVQAGLHLRSENGALYRFGLGMMYRNYPLGLATQTIAAPYVATMDDSGKVFMGVNASAMPQVTLPATVVGGVVYEFLVFNAQGFRVRAQGPHVIRHGATTGAAAGAIEVAVGAPGVGATLRLLAINTTVWQVMSFIGTWTLIA